MGKPEEGYLIKRIEDLRGFQSVFGETQYVSLDDARNTDEKFVWHVKTKEDSSGWLNGISSEPEPVDYWVAARPWFGERESIYVITDEFFDCPTCEGGSVSDPDECDECDGYGCVVIDFEGVLYEKPDVNSDDEIWELRESQ